MADDGWDDLFAKAADIPHLKQQSFSDYRDRDDEDERPSGAKGRNNTRRKRKRALKGRDGKPRQYDAAVESMLQTRMDSLDFLYMWPFWTKCLTTGLDGSSSCAGWTQQDNIATTATALSEPISQSYNCRCVKCGQLDIHHRMEFSSSTFSSDWGKEKSWPILILSYIRNIRCSAKAIAKSSEKTNVTSLIAGIKKDIQELSNLKPIYMSQLRDDDDFVLSDRLNCIERAYRYMDPNSINLSNAKKTIKDKTFKTVGSTKLMESAIRVIIECDAAYYRLYYIQLTGKLPTLYVENDAVLDGRQIRLFLPHPQEYFTVLLGSVDEIAYQAVNLIPQKRTKDIESILSYCDCSSMTGSVARNENDNPLATIFKCLWWETVELFYNTGWSRSDRVKEAVLTALRQPMTSLEDGLEEHETPAPKLLRDWRESCRVFPCHLYAYATFSPDSLSRLSSSLLQHKISRLVEMGAGTGYTARILSHATAAKVTENYKSFTIDAHDKFPTPEFDSTECANRNEYHGYTPRFFQLKPFSGFHNAETRDTALLLCYPPPQSSMAHDYLKSYLDAGGRFVVHVGEFKGLTGNSRFERLLLHKMVCVERLHILTWGTDASHITIWMLQKDIPKCLTAEAYVISNHHVLLRCSTCNVCEARMRCRLDRSLVYCSETCFEEGKSMLTTQLRLRMIEVDSSQLRYDDPFLFLEI